MNPPQAILRARAPAALCVVLGALLLAACQAGPAFQGGRPSAVSKPNQAFLRRLGVSALPAPRPAYGAVDGCSYRAVGNDMQGKYGSRTFELSVRRARDRLLVSMTNGGLTSTALIGPDGKLFDFNLAGAGQPLNADTFPAYAKRRAAALKPVEGADGHVVNELALYFPHYSAAQLVPGQAAATIADENDRPWARYVYRGTAVYEGRAVFVLDLLRRSAAKPQQGERTIGFSLVDRQRMLPLLLILESTQKIHLRQVRCR
ncbi:MAG: hypothetical protein JWN69_1786 [Alphaproteobacteria bacterium]|nr:hypothetical protein [Alphaproteobacteria bacterium]